MKNKEEQQYCRCVIASEEAMPPAMLQKEQQLTICLSYRLYSLKFPIDFQ